MEAVIISFLTECNLASEYYPVPSFIFDSAGGR